MSINISELIWTVICFFVLLVVLKKLLFDPLVSFMAARDARIQDGISAGRTAQQQLDAAAQARSDRRLHDPGIGQIREDPEVGHDAHHFSP